MFYYCGGKTMVVEARRKKNRMLLPSVLLLLLLAAAAVAPTSEAASPFNPASRYGIKLIYIPKQCFSITSLILFFRLSVRPDGGYEGLVVRVAEDVEESECQEIIQRIKVREIIGCCYERKLFIWPRSDF